MIAVQVRNGPGCHWVILGAVLFTACSQPRPYTGANGGEAAGGIQGGVGGKGGGAGQGLAGQGGAPIGGGGTGGSSNNGAHGGASGSGASFGMGGAAAMGGGPATGGAIGSGGVVASGGVGGGSAGTSQSAGGSVGGSAAHGGSSGQEGVGGFSPCASIPAPSPPLLDRPMRGFYSGSLHAPKVLATLRPTFTWKTGAAACGTTRYEIQADDSCSPGTLDSCVFPSPEIDMSGLSETSFTPANDLKVSTVPPVGAIYAWRVRACDDSARCSTWSEIRYVQVGRVREDINGDGYGDLMGWSGDGLDVYMGNGQFDVSASSAHIPFPNHCGFSSSFLGDVNGDGYGDFLTTQTYSPSAGCVPVLFYGGNSVQSLSSVIMTKTAGGPSTNINAKSAGDFNGDGYADVIVQWGYGNFTPESQVRIYWGGRSLSADPDLTIPGPYPNFEGFSDSGRIGDVDGDGYEDVGLLAFDIDPTKPAVGKIQVFFGGSTPDTLPDVEVATAQAAGSIGPAGDVDGDGYGDVVVRVGHSYGILHGGAALLGPLNQTWSEADSSSILGGFDMNGDHLADFAVGRSGASPLLYLGSVATPMVSQGGLSNVLLPVAASFSDHDGDGRPDLIFIDTSGGNAEWVGSDGTTNPHPRQVFSLTGDVVR